MSDTQAGRVRHTHGKSESNDKSSRMAVAQQQLASASRMQASGAHRMFPLPLVPLAPAPSAAHFPSRRIQQRHSRRRLVVRLTNAALTACTIQSAGSTSTAHQLHFQQLQSSTMYHAPPQPHPPPPPFISTGRRALPPRLDPFDPLCPSSTPPEPPSTPAPLHPTTAVMTDRARAFPSSSPIAAQRRAVQHIQQQCSSFVNQCRASQRALAPSLPAGVSASPAASSDGVAQLRQLCSYLHTKVAAPTPASTRTNARSHSSSDPLHSTATAPLAPFDVAASSPSSPSHAHAYAVPAVVVPILAHRIALPTTLQSVPILSLLPGELAADYAQPAQLLRDPISVALLNLARPLPPPRVSGSRSEYVRLLLRMQAVGMIAFTRAPKAVNGLFAVEKDADADRLIIDAQPANRLFADPPHVSLPNPSHLVQLQVEAGSKMYLAKSDLSNFYHQLRLPEEWQPYFALPPLTLLECEQLGLPCEPDLPPLHPMCVTLPMGFSHAVFLAQRAHEHVLYRHAASQQQPQPTSERQLQQQQQQQQQPPLPALQRRDNILCMESPVVDRCVHGLYIDDLWLMSPRFDDIDTQYRACLAAYAFAGLPDSIKKREPPLQTPKPIKAIGVRMDGVQLTLSIAVEDRLKLAQATISLLQARTVTGKQLSQLVGSWTWCILLRRSSLCVLQHVYRYIAVAGDQPYVLWPSVRRELQCLLCLVPLLHTNMSARFFPLAYASDASEFAAGVVAAPLTPSFSTALYPLSSSPRFNLLPLHRLHESSSAALQMPVEFVAHVDSLVADLRPRMEPSLWRVLIASRWRAQQHINVLELHAVLLALRHALSSPSSISARIFMLVDSAVAYYTLWKGRSSSRALLPVLRQINSHLLVTGASLQPCWIPSAWNPADAPSRLRAFPTAVTAAATAAVAAAAEQDGVAAIQLPFDTGSPRRARSPSPASVA